MRNGTAELNTLCGQLVDCEAGEYESGRDEIINQYAIKSQIAYQANNYSEATSTSDRICGNCTGGFSTVINAIECQDWDPYAILTFSMNQSQLHQLKTENVKVSLFVKFTNTSLRLQAMAKMHNVQTLQFASQILCTERAKLNK